MERLPLYVHVDDGVYPVCEDTLLMLSSVDVRRGERVLEVGCGTGLVSLHAAKCGAKTTFVDIDPAAVNCAYQNATDNDLEVDAYQSDLFENVEGTFDIIIFNPPYLPGTTGEGDMRLDGGKGGIETAERFLNDAKEHLTKGGVVYLLLSSLSHRDELESQCSGWVWNEVGEKETLFRRAVGIETNSLMRSITIYNPGGFIQTSTMSGRQECNRCLMKSSLQIDRRIDGVIW